MSVTETVLNTIYSTSTCKNKDIFNYNSCKMIKADPMEEQSVVLVIQFKIRLTLTVGTYRYRYTWFSLLLSIVILKRDLLIELVCLSIIYCSM